jgi:putative flavoprotein involved in K+ transport
VTYDVAVIGAGQAGLAIGYFLLLQGKRFVILDAADSVGAAWRARWDSLLLFTPRRYDSLPGLAFPGDPDGYPTRDEVIAYLEGYAATFELPVELDSAAAATPAEAPRPRSLLVANEVRSPPEDGRVATGEKDSGS